MSFCDYLSLEQTLHSAHTYIVLSQCCLPNNNSYDSVLDSEVYFPAVLHLMHRLACLIGLVQIMLTASGVMRRCDYPGLGIRPND